MYLVVSTFILFPKRKSGMSKPQFLTDLVLHPWRMEKQARELLFKEEVMFTFRCNISINSSLAKLF